jgi:hypothetical protein
MITDEYHSDKWFIVLSGILKTGYSMTAGSQELNGD